MLVKVVWLPTFSFYSLFIALLSQLLSFCLDFVLRTVIIYGSTYV